MIKVTEVAVKGETGVKFKAGKPREDGKARPLMVTVKDEGSRMKLCEEAGERRPLETCVFVT